MHNDGYVETHSNGFDDEDEDKPNEEDEEDEQYNNKHDKHDKHDKPMNGVDDGQSEGLIMAGNKITHALNGTQPEPKRRKYSHKPDPEQETLQPVVDMDDPGSIDRSKHSRENNMSPDAGMLVRTDADEHDPWRHCIGENEVARLSDTGSMCNDEIMQALADMLVAMCPGYQHINSRVYQLPSDDMPLRNCDHLFAGLLEDAEQILVTINLRNAHWMLGRADLVHKRLVVYDSLHISPETEFSQHARRVMRQLTRYINQHQQQGGEEWPCEFVQVALQEGVVNCGVHVIVNLLHLITGTVLPTTVEAALYRLIFQAILVQPQPLQQLEASLADRMTSSC